MKTFILTAALACLICLVAGCDSAALRSGSASLTAQGHNVAKDE